MLVDSFFFFYNFSSSPIEGCSYCVKERNSRPWPEREELLLVHVIMEGSPFLFFLFIQSDLAMFYKGIQKYIH